MTIQDLLDLIPPPDTPLHNQDTGQFEALEAKYGFRFPESYREICRRYGSGAFDPATADMHNALAPCYERDIDSMLTAICIKVANLQNISMTATVASPMKSSQMFREYSHGLAATRKRTSSGSWTLGNPEKWPIIVNLSNGIDDDDTCWLRYDLSLADFLIQSSLWTLNPPYKRRPENSTNGPKFMGEDLEFLVVFSERRPIGLAT